MEESGNVGRRAADSAYLFRSEEKR
jgi:hypothetical protein